MSSVLYEIREGSTFALDVVVKDLSAPPVVVTPTACKYTLKNRDGDVMNELLNVTVTPAESMRIILAGDDLAIEDETNFHEYRRLLIETDQGSVALPENIEVGFLIINLKAKVVPIA